MRAPLELSVRLRDMGRCVLSTSLRVRTFFRAVGRVRETGSFDCVRLGLTALRMTSVYELAPYAAATSLRHLLSGVKARRTLPPMALLYPAFT